MKGARTVRWGVHGAMGDSKGYPFRSMDVLVGSRRQAIAEVLTQQYSIRKEAGDFKVLSITDINEKIVPFFSEYQLLLSPPYFFFFFFCSPFLSPHLTVQLGEVKEKGLKVELGGVRGGGVDKSLKFF